jgi:peptide/nickel transport system substrate-binding protein
MKTRRLQKSFALLAAAGLLVAACGGDDDAAPEDSEETADTADTAEPEPTAEPTEDTGGSDVEATGDVDTEVTEESVDPEVDKYGGSISVGLEAEAVGLRPWEDACSAPCYNMMVTLYDKLIEQDVNGDYQGYLAESFSSNDDFTAWTVNLRPNVVFHNGVALTAQTIADMFPIQQEGASASAQVAASNLIGVEATGDLEVTYTLSSGNSAFPAFLARASLGMVFEPAAAAADIDGYSTNPIGTGPFMIETRDLDNETTVVRNENYWGVDIDGDQLPYLDSISFRPIPDEQARLDALLSGTVDAMHTLRQGTIRDARAEVDGGSDIKLLEFQGNNVGGGMFNLAVAPFDDLRVRLGLTQMNSQDNVIEALGGTGISLPGTQWFSPDSPWYSDAVAAAWPQFDFEAGKATLAEYVNDPARSDGKAVGDPIDVELSCPPDPTLIAAMQVLEQTWSGSGMVNVTLTNFDQQTHINNALGGENGFIGTHQAHCWRWSDQDDPSISLNPFLTPYSAENAEEAGLPGIVSPLNFANWWNADAFGAAQAAITTGDFDERYALYEQINMKIAEEVPIWFSGHTATMIATSAAVSGLNGWHLPSGDLGIGFPGAEGRWQEVRLVS